MVISNLSEVFVCTYLEDYDLNSVGPVLKTTNSDRWVEGYTELSFVTLTIQLCRPLKIFQESWKIEKNRKWIKQMVLLLAHMSWIFIFFSRTLGPISIKLGTKQGIQVCSNEGPVLFQGETITKLNHLAYLNQSSHKKFLGEGDSSLFK